MTKMQAAISSPSMMMVSLSFRRSRRLLASSQAFACSTTQRTVPSLDPCGSPLSRMSGRMPSAAQSLQFSARSMPHRRRAGQWRFIPPKRGAAGRKTASCRARWQRRQGHERKAVACHHHMILGAPLGRVSRVWPGQFAAACGAERTMRMSAACTRRSRASALHSRRRRRSLADPIPVARSSRHCTPSRRKNRRVPPPPRLDSADDHDRHTALQSSRSGWPPGCMSWVSSRLFRVNRTGKLDAFAIPNNRRNGRKLVISPPDLSSSRFLKTVPKDSPLTKCARDERRAHELAISRRRCRPLDTPASRAGRQRPVGWQVSQTVGEVSGFCEGLS